MVSALHARSVAREWVEEVGQSLPGFQGAFLHGSIIEMPDDAPVAPTSDVDVMVVVNDVDAVEKPGKFLYREVLLEVSLIAGEQVDTPEWVLGEYNLAGSFRRSGILADPTGRLTAVQAVVEEQFALRRWVEARCAQAMEKVRSGFPLRADDPFHGQVIAWLFPAGVLTHVLLVAAMENPTVRKRYVAARAVLKEYGRPDAYDRLLEILGAAEMSAEQMQAHLDAMTEAFDVAKTVIRSPLFFAADISDLARPVAVDGGQQLIDQGLHREAVFWIVATYSRCMAVFEQDGTPELYARFEPGYHRLLADFGIASLHDLQRRRGEVEQALPWIGDVAREIMDANPAIEQ